MTTKEKIVRQSITKITKRLDVLNGIMNASPASDLIETNKNEYYVKENDFENWTSQVSFVMNDDFEGIDWLVNNSNYEDKR